MFRANAATILLTTWERAYGLGSVERGLALLSLARPQQSPAQLAETSIGERDTALLDLRVNLFGESVQSLDACPQCGERIEVTFQIHEIRVPLLPNPPQADFAIDGRNLRLRPATSADLIAVEREPSLRQRREALARRCVSTISDDDHKTDALFPDDTTEERLHLVSEKLAEIDPQADVRMTLSCARCGQAWTSRFDIASFLWSELDAWARRILSEVHALAFAYGWAERDILSMTPWRRQLYMGMLRR